MPELEIHHINVSQGDCTFVVNRDVSKISDAIDAALVAGSGLPPKPADEKDYLPYAVKNKVSLVGTIRRALLIDAGDEAYGDDVAAYIAEQGVTKANARDVLRSMATHYHADHVGGFRDVFFEKFDFKKKLNEQKPYLVPKIAYDCGDLKKWDKTGTRAGYLAMVDALKSKVSRKTIRPNVKILMGDDGSGTPIKLRCIAANGVVATRRTAVAEVINPKKSPDQNARSVVLVVEYGDFRYFLGADAGGTGEESGGNFGKNKDTRTKTAFSSHPDIETSITEVLPKIYKKDANRVNTADGHICVHCADHHGSASSNDVFLVEQMQPKVLVCSAGVRRSFHWHPTQEFFQRVDANVGYSPKWQEPGDTTNDNPTEDNTVAGYYITEMAEDGRYGSGKSAKDYTRTLPNGKILGDVIVRPVSAVVPVNANGTNTISIQVYGTGLGTADSVTSIPLRDKTAGTPGSLYPIGPFTHDCDKH